MELSKFNFYSHYEKDKGGLIYNTNTGAIINIIDCCQWDTIKRNNIDSLTNEELTELCKQGIVVHSCMEEFNIIKERYYKKRNSSASLFLTIMPTDACNFRCPYCFVYKKSTNFMKQQVYDEIFELIKNQWLNASMEELVINWFGGEPSLCNADILQFTERINEINKNNAFKFQSTVTTNGYLMDKKSFEAFVDIGVANMQFTIDGSKEAHDNTRILNNGNGTYDRIMKNLADIAQIPIDKRFNLNVRCNFTKKNVKSVEAFIDTFFNAFGHDDRFKIYCRPVYYYNTESNEINLMKSELFTLTEGIEMQNHLAIRIQNRTKKETSYRIINPLPFPTSCWCNAEMLNHYIIGPKGEIYVCDTLTGEENTYGTIFEINRQKRKKSLDVKYDIFADGRTKKCMDCQLLPICMGACMRNRIYNEAQCYWTKETISNALNNFCGHLLKEEAN